MGQLDVSFMVVDPLLSTCFKVYRRKDAVDNHGRSTPTLVQTFPRVPGVITQEDGELHREKDAQTAARVINVVTRFALQGPVKDKSAAATAYQPDIIEWHGTQYLVTSCEPYPNFGRGTVQAQATSMATIDFQQK